MCEHYCSGSRADKLPCTRESPPVTKQRERALEWETKSAGGSGWGARAARGMLA